MADSNFVYMEQYSPYMGKVGYASEGGLMPYRNSGIQFNTNWVRWKQSDSNEEVQLTRQ